jgi:4-diphosphocytidyl-2-C-methyl-D-erythritol kinase
MQTVSIADSLAFTRVEEGITVTCASPAVPAGAGNLAYRALALLLPRLPGGIRLDIEKRIPMAAGLGGGSSDAAAALRGADLLYRLGLEEEELIRYAARLGSDVPFFILGGTVLARGRGEIVTRIPPLPSCWLVLVKPDFGVSTGEVYARFRPGRGEPRTPKFISALARGDRAGMLAALGNDLEQVTVQQYPAVLDRKARLDGLGAEKTLMAGSGPAVFGIFPGESEARFAAEQLAGGTDRVFICRTIAAEEIKSGKGIGGTDGKSGEEITAR